MHFYISFSTLFLISSMQCARSLSGSDTVIFFRGVSKIPSFFNIFMDLSI